MTGYKIMKWISVVVAIAILIFAIIGGYILFNKMFPLADPLEHPCKDDVTLITIEHDMNGSRTIDKERYDDLMSGIKDAEPTREWSVNDYPTVKSYYTVSLNTDGRAFRYFVYRDGGRVYIESAYEGIYLTNEGYLQLIESFYETN